MSVALVLLRGGCDDLLSPELRNGKGFIKFEEKPGDYQLNTENTKFLSQRQQTCRPDAYLLFLEGTCFLMAN